MMPKFFESEWFVPEPDNWHLKPGAPKEIVDEFNEWMNAHNSDDSGIDVDWPNRPQKTWAVFFCPLSGTSYKDRLGIHLLPPAVLLAEFGKTGVWCLPRFSDAGAKR